MNIMKSSNCERNSSDEVISWEDYEEIIISEWNSLLNRKPDPSEDEIQRFLEQYPTLIPGAFNEFNIESGHPP